MLCVGVLLDKARHCLAERAHAARRTTKNQMESVQNQNRCKLVVVLHSLPFATRWETVIVAMRRSTRLASSAASSDAEDSLPYTSLAGLSQKADAALPTETRTPGRVTRKTRSSSVEPQDDAAGASHEANAEPQTPSGRQTRRRAATTAPPSSQAYESDSDASTSSRVTRSRAKASVEAPLTLTGFESDTETLQSATRSTRRSSVNESDSDDPLSTRSSRRRAADGSLTSTPGTVKRIGRARKPAAELNPVLDAVAEESEPEADDHLATPSQKRRVGKNASAVKSAADLSGPIDELIQKTPVSASRKRNIDEASESADLVAPSPKHASPSLAKSTPKQATPKQATPSKKPSTPADVPTLKQSATPKDVSTPKQAPTPKAESSSKKAAPQSAVKSTPAKSSTPISKSTPLQAAPSPKPLVASPAPTLSAVSGADSDSDDDAPEAVSQVQARAAATVAESGYRQATDAYVHANWPAFTYFLLSGSRLLQRKSAAVWKSATFPKRRTSSAARLRSCRRMYWNSCRLPTPPSVTRNRRATVLRVKSPKRARPGT